MIIEPVPSAYVRTLFDDADAAIARATLGAAALNGDAAQVFNVASAGAVGNAVSLGQFGSSLATTGYIKMPDASSPAGGRVEQWGTFSLAAAGGSSQVITFPIAFPFSLANVDISVDGAASEMIGTSARTLTGMTINKGNGDTTARTGFWRVNGY